MLKAPNSPRIAGKEFRFINKMGYTRACTFTENYKLRSYGDPGVFEGVRHEREIGFGPKTRLEGSKSTIKSELHALLRENLRQATHFSPRFLEETDLETLHDDDAKRKGRQIGSNYWNHRFHWEEECK